METSNSNLMRFAAPAVALLAALVALFGQWFTTTTSVTKHTLDSTLLEVIQGESFVEYTTSRWLWISAAGVVLVVVSALVGDQFRKKLAETGSFLMVILSGWSLFQVFVGDEDIDAGWGMWIVAALSVAVIILARMMPDDETPEVQPLQRIEQVEQ